MAASHNGAVASSTVVLYHVLIHMQAKALYNMACVVRSEELGRPENKDLKSFVDKLAGVKQIIDDKGKTAGKSLCISSGT